MDQGHSPESTTNDTFQAVGHPVWMEARFRACRVCWGMLILSNVFVQQVPDDIVVA